MLCVVASFENTQKQKNITVTLPRLDKLLKLGNLVYLNNNIFLIS